jgi:hypothetical protein
MDAVTSIVQNIEKEVPALAKTCLGEFLDQASQSVKSLISSNTDKIRGWLSQLTAGKLSKEDFNFLLQSEFDLSAMESLKEMGIGEIQLEKFRNGVIGLVENAILSAIP